MKKRVLLTGATGNVGRNTLEVLLKNDYDVTAFDLPNKRSKKILGAYKNKIKAVYGSINDVSLVERLVSDADVVIHLAAIIPPLADKKPELAKQVNYLGTENIVRAIKERNPSCFLIFSSSISIYGDRTEDYRIKTTDPLTPSEGDYYALTKIVSEKMIREAGIGYTIFRFSAIMGLPHTDPLMFHMPLDTKLEIAPSSMTAEALVKACENADKLNGRIFNLGGGEAYRTDYRAFLSEMLKLYGLNFKYFNEKAFAEKNFHCGYLEDSYVLNDILDFQHGTIEDYYAFVKKHTPSIIRFFSRIFA
ncbi:MAG: NAD(P)-dependent oxidoreductase, partial [Clostridiales bacterium]|nr:NAD(P)-dependent oxidoreductase [Clostridiales bacterium]